ASAIAMASTSSPPRVSSSRRSSGFSAKDMPDQGTASLRSSAARASARRSLWRHAGRSSSRGWPSPISALWWTGRGAAESDATAGERQNDEAGGKGAPGGGAVASRKASRSSSGRYRPGHGHVQIGDQPARQRVDPAMHRQGLAARPRLLDEDVGGNIPHLADDVQLAKPVQSLALVGAGGELVLAVVRDLADRMQPVVDEAPALAV